MRMFFLYKDLGIVEFKFNTVLVTHQWPINGWGSLKSYYIAEGVKFPVFIFVR